MVVAIIIMVFIRDRMTGMIPVDGGQAGVMAIMEDGPPTILLIGEVITVIVFGRVIQVDHIRLKIVLLIMLFTT